MCQYFLVCVCVCVCVTMFPHAWLHTCRRAYRLAVSPSDAAPVFTALGALNQGEETVLLPADFRRTWKNTNAGRRFGRFTDQPLPLALALAHSVATLELPINPLGLSVECRWKSGRRKATQRPRNENGLPVRLHRLVVSSVSFRLRPTVVKGTTSV